MTDRWVVVNADDFGLSPGVNRGIIAAHELGIVTSASLMTRWPAAKEAAAYARSRPQLGVGLHVDLGEWVCERGEWRPLYQVVSQDPRHVRQEVLRQLEAFRALVGRDPDHLDSHQHVHRDEPARSVLKSLARELHVPLRHFTQGIVYHGEFYGQSDAGEPFPELVSPESLIKLLRTLPTVRSELACHPAANADFQSMYADERLLELKSLCDPQVRAAAADEGLHLVSFRDFAGCVIS